MLTGLLVSTHKQVDAKVRATKLLANAPREWRAYEVLAYLNFREGDWKGAAENFAKAFEFGASSPKTYYDAARVFLYAGNRDDTAVVYLNKAIALFPQWTDARIQLVEEFLFLRKPEAALAAAMKLPKIDAKNASRLFRARAWAEVMRDNDDRARTELASALKWAKTPLDESEAHRVQDYLKHRLEVQAARANGGRPAIEETQQQGRSRWQAACRASIGALRKRGYGSSR